MSDSNTVDEVMTLPPAGAGGPVAMDQIERLRRDLGDGLREVVRAFIERLDQVALEIKGFIDLEMYDEALQPMAALESSCFQLGAVRLAEVSKAIRQYLQAGGWSHDRERLDWLMFEFEIEASKAKTLLSSAMVMTGPVKPKTEIVFDDVPLLIVVPDETTRAIVHGTLLPDGYRLLEAHGREEALALFHEHLPAAALIDDLSIHGGGQPFQLCSDLRQLDRNMPILVVTEYSDEMTVKRAVDAGASDFISRPIYMPVLRQRMRYMCGTEIGRRQVLHMAMHDMLTGLPNRYHLSELMNEALERHRAQGRQFAVLFVDLDGFKEVNDAHGHNVGDEVLRQVTVRMQQSLGEKDLLARMGGDEFVGIVSGLEALGDIRSSATIPAMRILEALSRPFDINGSLIQVGASIGMAVYPEHGTTQDELINIADRMMYTVKGSGKNSYRMCEG